MPGSPVSLYPEIARLVEKCRADFAHILEGRRVALESIAAFARARVREGRSTALTFICTHNSRRSHMAQIWARTAAAAYAVPGVETYSGGTEATAFEPRAVAAMRRAGFRIEVDGSAGNPLHRVRFSPEEVAIEVFSKEIAAEPNPKGDFVAVMTCSSADEACPIVDGAVLRVVTPYVDPKESDGTEHEAPTYDARCRQIATEMLYLFSKVDTRAE